MTRNGRPQKATVRPDGARRHAGGTRGDSANARPRQAEALVALAEAGAPVAVAALCKACGATHQTIQALVKAGFVETVDTAVGRDPYAQETFVPNAQETLMPEQAAALAVVQIALDAPAADKKPVLYCSA